MNLPDVFSLKKYILKGLNIMSTSTRLFGEPLSMKKELHEVNEQSKFSLKTDVSRLTNTVITYPKDTKKETIEFANSIEATLFAKAEDAEGFIQRIFTLEQLDMKQLLASDTPKEADPNWFFDMNYVAVYFAAVGAVALAIIDVVKNGVEEQKFILNHNSKPFVTVLLSASRQAGGVSFSEKVAKVFAEQMLDAYHGLEG